MKPIILAIINGLATQHITDKTPTLKKYFKTELEADAENVGLPEKFLGNPEVGHVNLGAGRIVTQEEQLIEESILNGSFFENKELKNAINNAKKKKAQVHLLGLLQDAGIQAHEDHLFALMKLCQLQGIKPIIHVFTDGRDSPRISASHYLTKLQIAIKQYGGKIGTITGRYYAMNNSNAWQRTKQAYDAIYKAEGKKFKSWERAIKNAYSKEETDEYIKPRIISGYHGVKDNDTLICFNYRRDRIKQLAHAFNDKSFSRFERRRQHKTTFIGLTEYYPKLKAIYKKKTNRNTLTKVLENHKKTQIRIASPSAYSNVTYYFNDEIEKPSKKEDRKKVSKKAKQIRTNYTELTTLELFESLNTKEYQFALVNYPSYYNALKKGQTGEEQLINLDTQIARLAEKAKQKNGVLIVSSDHAYQQAKRDDKGKIIKQEKLTVPFCTTDKNKYKKGHLGNVAPTILELMKIKKPKEMQESLISKNL